MLPGASTASLSPSLSLYKVSGMRLQSPHPALTTSTHLGNPAFLELSAGFARSRPTRWLCLTPAFASCDPLPPLQ